jgi:hypothetical protein
MKLLPVLFGKGKDIFTDREPAPFGIGFNQLPFGGVKSKAANNSLISGGRAACLVRPLPAPAVAHIKPFIFITKIKPAKAIKKQSNAKTKCRIYRILRSLQKNGIVKVRGLRPAASYLITASKAAIPLRRVPKAITAVDIATIHSTCLMALSFFDFAICFFLLGVNHALILIHKANFVNYLFQKNKTIFLAEALCSQ